MARGSTDNSKLGFFDHRWRADHASRDLLVLFADRQHHIRRRQIARGKLVWVQPDAHGVIAGAEHEDLAHAWQAPQIVFQIQHRVVAQIELVVTTVGRDQIDDQGQIGRLLLRGHTNLADFIRQPWQSALHAVLHLVFGQIGIGADLERDAHLQRAVGGRHRGHVEHVLDAVDLLARRRSRR